ncbi:thioredoxin family protein [Flavobacterium sp.]|jgi:thioredoxin-related protein|uniref:thioredoxin family protein n=1 Tax=Flavobacterium sp. TaxID=239 RepID=UPI0022CC2173|nr:thioredoxin family protein [Flavobacterium sp.]MCZ8145049.1 thioredoxin family protein [Flavobacterium sp.]MCZ8368051.1 thioredoxin family protein [Flavobacterium sp.]
MKLSFLLITTFFILNLSFAQVTKLDDWDSAKEQSELSGKKILIILTGAEWCKPCVKMEKNVMENQQFIDYANQNLIIFEINIPRNQNYNTKTMKDYLHFKNKYVTNALPIMILVDKNGTEILRISNNLSSLENVLEKLKKYN